MRLGFELETALVVEPDYFALGPIYPTTLKVMKWGAAGARPYLRLKTSRRQPSPNGHRRACHVAVSDKLDVQKQAPAPKSVHSNGCSVPMAGELVRNLNALDRVGPRWIGVAPELCLDVQ